MLRLPSHFCSASLLMAATGPRSICTAFTTIQWKSSQAMSFVIRCAILAAGLLSHTGEEDTINKATCYCFIQVHIHNRNRGKGSRDTHDNMMGLRIVVVIFSFSCCPDALFSLHPSIFFLRLSSSLCLFSFSFFLLSVSEVSLMIDKFSWGWTAEGVAIFPVPLLSCLNLRAPVAGRYGLTGSGDAGAGRCSRGRVIRLQSSQHQGPWSRRHRRWSGRYSPVRF